MVRRRLGSLFGSVLLAVGVVAAGPAAAADLWLDVLTDPDPARVAPGGEVRFSPVALLPAEDLTLLALTSDALGNLADPANPALQSTTCVAPLPLPYPHDPYGAYDFGCTYTVGFDGPPGDRADTVRLTIRRHDGTESTASASADVTVTAALGALTGTLTDDVTGDPLSGVRVMALGASTSRGATTDATGRFGFPDLPPGGYRVTAGNLVELVASDYAPEWYRDKPDFTSADAVPVTAGATAVVDLALAVGGRITGTVTDAATGEPLEGADVSVRGGSIGGPIDGHLTDGSGRYTVTGLPTGSYQVCASRADGDYAWTCRPHTVFVEVRGLAESVDLTLAPAAPQAELSVSVTLDGPAFAGGPAAATIRVANPGTVPVTDVVVEQTGDGCSRTVEGPTVLVGNSDQVLEPAETWAYTCAADAVLVPVIEVTVTAADPADTTVTADARLVYALAEPFAVTVTPSATRVLEGTTVDWTIDVRNVGNYPMTNVFAQGRVLFPGWVGPIPSTDAAGPQRLDGDGDGVFEPDETWRFVVALPVVVKGSTLEAAGGGAPLTSPGTHVAFTAESAALGVVPAPVIPVLPDTGASGRTTLLASTGLLLVLVGAALTAAARPVTVSSERAGR